MIAVETHYLWIDRQPGPFLRLLAISGSLLFFNKIDVNTPALQILIPWRSISRIWIGEGANLVKAPKDRVPC